ncbi:DoxX family protein [Cohnella suwonensis]|uniref:DoxX family protein n=1 Tax=Cohnella suwonensis TaxID=696072 RepID=A0ABW0LZ17_9BACL
MDIVSYILQGLLGLAFLGAGFGKVSGSKMHVEGFKKWGLPQWFRVFTGLVEIVGAAGLIVGYWEPSWAALAGLGLGVTMVVAMLVHVRIKDSMKETMPSILLAILSLVVFAIQAGDLADFPGF